MMFSKLIEIFVCFNIALGSRLHPKLYNNVQEDFVRLDGEAGSGDHSLDSITCGNPEITPNTSLRIMGGEEAIPNSWPWQVSVQFKYNDTFYYFCGGSIVSKTKIISAAHCIFDINTGAFKPITNLYVVAGIHDIRSSYSTTQSQSKKVIKMIAPDEYNARRKGTPHDIAILYIDDPGFTFNDKVQPVCLPTTNVPDGISCFATGWGSLWKNQPNVFKKLYQVKVPIITYIKCFSYLGPTITTSMICAGYVEGGKDICHGDSGGPLVCHRDGAWILDGVVSWGNGCGRRKSPGVYTRVFDYLDWINSN